MGRGHFDHVTAIALDEFDTRVLSGCRDGICMLWTLRVPRKGETSAMGMLSGPDHILHGHTMEVTALALCSQADLAITAALDATCNIHTLRKGQYLRTLSPAPDGPSRYDEALVVATVKKKQQRTSGEHKPHEVGAVAEASAQASATQPPVSDAAATPERGGDDESAGDERDAWVAQVELVLLTAQGTCVVHTTWTEREPAAPTAVATGATTSAATATKTPLPPPTPAKRRKRHTLHVYSCNGHLLALKEESHRLTNMCAGVEGDHLITVDRHGHVNFYDLQT